ncbi:MAG: OmpA family protein [Bacteroidetes bacterium]|nr:OmpA family protein [Bacteroidota bacterium]MCW5894523.1 OmpA family protein [Bacteroidota bacterium]
MKFFMLAAFLMLLDVHSGLSQQAVKKTPMFSTDGKWSLSFHGGANIWISDLNTRRASPGGDLVLRYGLSRRFSFGIMLGYDRLIGIEHPETVAPNPASPPLSEYMALSMASANFIVVYNYPITLDFRPYVYAGIGGAAYLRQDRFDNHIPDGGDRIKRTLHIPVGFGFEIPMSQNVSFAIDLGARIMDDYTDDWKGNSIIEQSTRPGIADWYPTGRLGFNFYFGKNDDDDDPDNDGLTNTEERRYGTNPYNADSDGDGLKDGEEIFRHNTNPLKWDTDGDGLSDGDEVLKYKTFPNRTDSDEDGLNDGHEVLKYETNPLKPDTDGDGLTDGDEVLKYGTDPLKADTDGDSLSDGDEILRYRTDPRNKDTDGGGVDDGTEVKRGTNPLDKSDDFPVQKRELKAEVGQAVVLEGIVFQTGKATITPVSEDILTLALNTLRQHPDMTVEIRGHTDNTGSRSLNDGLSQRRADAVRLWLLNRGIAANRITATGFGQDYPIDTNLTAEGRQRNRRIEFFRTK